MLKAVSYAYPTSDVAARFGRSYEGCYYVKITRDELDVLPERIGPYVTLADAELAACFVDAPWNRFLWSRYSLHERR